MRILKFFITALLLFCFQKSFCQWKQSPVSIGSADFLFQDKISSNIYLVSNNQVYIHHLNKWNVLPSTGLPNASNTIIKAGIANNNKLIIGVISLPQAGFYEYNKSIQKWSRLDFISEDSFSINSMEFENNRIYVGLNSFKKSIRIPNILYTENYGIDWQSDMQGMSFQNFIYMEKLLFHNNTYYMITNSNELYKKSANDTVWQIFLNGIDTIMNLNPRNITEYDNHLYMSARKGIFKYNSNKGIWESFNTGLLENDSVKSGLVAVYNNNLITYGSSYTSRRAYFFNGNSSKWELFNAFDSLININILSKSDTLFIASTIGLFYIKTLFDSRNYYMNGIDNANVTNLEIIDNQMYATSNNVVLQFKDGINTNPLKHELSQTYANRGLVQAKNNIIVINTKGMGVYDKGMNLSYYVPQFHNSNVSTIYKFNKYIYANSGQSNFVCHEDSLIWRKTDLNTAIRQFYYHNGFIYAAGSTTGLYRTSIENENWEFLSGAFGPQQIQGVTAYNNTILVTTRDGLLTYNLTDKSWSKINTPFDNLGFQKIIYFNGKIVVNTLFQSGVYVADTNDFIFHPLFNGINVNHFFINNMLIHNDTLFLASTQGIWYRPLHNINTSIRRYNENKMAVSVFPNPASSQVNISCTNEKIKGIVVYNSLGQKMDEVTINNHQHIYQTSHLKEGIYFFNIMLNNQNMINHKIVVGY
jgi:hypothetical protein